MENSEVTVTTLASQAEEAIDTTSSPVAENLASSSSTLASSSTANISKIDATPQEEKATRGKLLKSHSVSTGTSPPPQNISTQVSVYRSNKIFAKYSMNE